jgi:hypothetical protein
MRKYAVRYKDAKTNEYKDTTVEALGIVDVTLKIERESHVKKVLWCRPIRPSGWRGCQE